MIDNKTTPEAIARGEYGEQDVDSWFAIASARQLERYILCKKPYTRVNRSFENVKAFEEIERAQIALNIRQAEDAAKTADKLIQHTEKLTQQTDIHIQHAEKLTQQTDVLVAESSKLGRLTWALIILTVGLLFLTAGLLWVDWHREH